MAELVYDVTPQFKELLDELKLNHADLQIHYFYPNKFTNKACISYKLAQNSITDTAIRKTPRRQEAEYYVDFWGASPEELCKLATELKVILAKAGYVCSFDQDLKELNEKYYHKSTRFKLVFDNKLKTVL